MIHIGSRYLKGYKLICPYCNKLVQFRITDLKRSIFKKIKYPDKFDENDPVVCNNCKMYIYLDPKYITIQDNPEYDKIKKVIKFTN